MNDVFDFRDQLISEYSRFLRSFVKIAAADIKNEIECQYTNGRYWLEPLVQINPNYKRKGTVQLLAPTDYAELDACYAKLNGWC